MLKMTGSQQLGSCVRERSSRKIDQRRDRVLHDSCGVPVLQKRVTTSSFTFEGQMMSAWFMGRNSREFDDIVSLADLILFVKLECVSVNFLGQPKVWDSAYTHLID
jgi:hypothetical protein